MRIAIIGAMAEELQYMRGVIDVIGVEKIGKLEFVIGNISEIQVVLVCSGIGKVNAAMAMSIMLATYEPDAVINLGSAGALQSDLRTGDLVIANEVSYFDVDVTAFGYDIGQVPREPRYFYSEPKLASLFLKQYSSKGLHNSFKGGLVVTGDTFVQSEKNRKFLISEFPNVLAIDMESAALANVAYKFNVPILIIKIISDGANEDAKKDFKTNINEITLTTTKVLVEIINNLF